MNVTARKIKYSAEISMHSERIKLIDKKNRYAAFLLCNDIETWDYATLCEEQKEKRFEAKKL